MTSVRLDFRRLVDRRRCDVFDYGHIGRQRGPFVSVEFRGRRKRGSRRTKLVIGMVMVMKAIESIMIGGSVTYSAMLDARVAGGRPTTVRQHLLPLNQVSCCYNVRLSGRKARKDRQAG